MLTGGPVAVTTLFGKNGGNRCRAQNAKAGGAKHSKHIDNEAADIVANGFDGLALAKLATHVEVFRNGGIGIARNHILVDVRRGKARWGYSSTPSGWKSGLAKYERSHDLNKPPGVVAIDHGLYKIEVEKLAAVMLTKLVLSKQEMGAAMSTLDKLRKL